MEVIKKKLISLKAKLDEASNDADLAEKELEATLQKAEEVSSEKIKSFFVKSQNLHVFY